MVCGDLPSDSFVFHSVVLKLLGHLGDVISEDLLKLSDTLPPNCLNINNSGDSLDSDVFRQLHQKSSVKRIVRVDDLVWVLWILALEVLTLNSQASVAREVIFIIIFSALKILNLIFHSILKN